MNSDPLIFLFIHEDSEAMTKRKVMALESILGLLQYEGRSPGDNETYETLLRGPNFKPHAMIVSLQHPDLQKIIDIKNETNERMPVIFLYKSGQEDYMMGLKNKYNVKYELCRNNMCKTTLKGVLLKISSDHNFEDKNSSQRYVLRQNLGRGASSVVDLYYDSVEKRLVAIKKLQVEGLVKVEREKIQKEVELMSAIKIPTAIQLYGFDIENDTRFIYMEYAEQGTLEEKIRQNQISGNKFTVDEIYNYLIDILLALFALNKKEIMHRDIKSENILLKEETYGERKTIVAKLSDLGISRKIDSVIGSMTQCGTVRDIYIIHNFLLALLYES